MAIAQVHIVHYYLHLRRLTLPLVPSNDPSSDGSLSEYEDVLSRNSIPLRTAAKGAKPRTLFSSL